MRKISFGEIIGVKNKNNPEKTILTLIKKLITELRKLSWFYI